MSKENTINDILSLYTKYTKGELSIEDKKKLEKKISNNVDLLLELAKHEVIWNTLSFKEVPDDLLSQVLNNKTVIDKIYLHVEESKISIIKNKSSYKYSYSYKRNLIRQSKLNEDSPNTLVLKKDNMTILIFNRNNKINFKFHFNSKELMNVPISISYFNKLTKKTKLIASLHPKQNKTFFKGIPPYSCYYITILNNKLELILSFSV